MGRRVMVKEKAVYDCDICEKELKANAPRYYEWPVGDWNGYGRSIGGFRMVVKIEHFCAVSEISREGTELTDICEDCMKKALKNMAEDKKHSWFKS